MKGQVIITETGIGMPLAYKTARILLVGPLVGIPAKKQNIVAFAKVAVRSFFQAYGDWRQAVLGCGIIGYIQQPRRIAVKGQSGSIGHAQLLECGIIDAVNPFFVYT